MKIFVNLFVALILLCSCNRPQLIVQTDYITHKDLASFYVGTPDPRLNMPMIGQRLIISWMLPREYLSYENLYLEITIRFRNREEIIEIFDITRAKGTYVFSLLNQDYIDKRGILTYKINLIGGGYVLKEWKHLIWSDLITIPTEEKLIEEEDETYLIEWDK